MTNGHPGEVAEGDTESPLPLEIVFRALANERRRTILYHLTSCTYPVPFEEVVDKVAVQESKTYVTDIPAKVYEQIALDLHHTHLPKLAQWGIIEYEKDLKLITVAETLRPLDEYLHLTKQHDLQVETQDNL